MCIAERSVSSIFDPNVFTFQYVLPRSPPPPEPESEPEPELSELELFWLVASVLTTCAVRSSFFPSSPKFSNSTSSFPSDLSIYSLHYIRLCYMNYFAMAV